MENLLGKKPVGLEASVFVHPLAFVECSAIGSGTRVWGFAHVMRDAKVGTDCNIGENTFIENGAVVGNRVTVKNGVSIWDKITIEDDVFVGPAVVFTNDVRPRAFVKRGRDQFPSTHIGKGATLGGGSVLVPGVTVGAFAFVAAGSVVTKNVPPNGYVRGNPARLVGYACECAATLTPLSEVRKSCASCGK